MTDLPPGWEWTTLGEIADTTLGKMLDRGKSGGHPHVPYLRNVNVQWGQIDLTDVNTMELASGRREEFALREGDLLVCEGGEVGRCAIYQGGPDYMAFQKALHRIRPRAGVEAQYLRYLLEHYGGTGSFKPFVTGSTIKHLPQIQLRRLPVPLPSAVEQRRIVTALEEELSRIDAGLGLLGNALDGVDRLERTIIRASLVSPNREVSARAPRHPQVDDGELPPIPGSWRWMRLDEIAEVVGGVPKDAAKQSDPSTPLVPYLRVANVQRGWLDLGEVSEIRVTEDRAQRLVLRHGDVLLNEGGDRDKLGRGWIWESQIDGCIHQNHVFRARIRDDQLHPKLLAWHANSFGKSWFERNGRQTTNLASISLSKIKQLPVPVPPVEDQRLLVEYIEDQLTITRRTVATVRQSMIGASHLRRSLLADAFAGRLVPQDPWDESASVLLDRINAELQRCRET